MLSVFARRNGQQPIQPHVEEGQALNALELPGTSVISPPLPALARDLPRTLEDHGRWPWVPGALTRLRDRDVAHSARRERFPGRAGRGVPRTVWAFLSSMASRHAGRGRIRSATLVLVASLQLTAAGLAEERRVSIVLSRSIAPYLSAAEGIKEVLLTGGVESVELYDMRGEMGQGNQIASQLAAKPPRVIVTVGTEATQAMSQLDVRTIPIVFSMVVHPEKLVTGDRPMFGASMEVSALEQLTQLKAVLPNVHRVGVVFNPAIQASWAMAQRQDVAKQENLELILQPISDASEISEALKALLTRVDALWLIPDETVLAPRTAEYLLLETLRYHIPVLAPSFLFVQRGALIAVGGDYREVGRQAGELTLKLLSGKRPPINVVEARKPMIYLNLRSARTLGVDVPQALINHAEQVVQ